MWNNGQEVKIAFEIIEPTFVEPHANERTIYRITRYNGLMGYYSSLSLFVGELIKNPSDFISRGAQVVSVKQNNLNHDLGVSYWYEDCADGSCEHYDDDKRVACSEVEMGYEEFTYERIELFTE
jgi:hypothetical protein